jgi:ribosomal protein L30E
MTYKGTSMDLAEVAGKLFIISALSIRESGDSDILKAIETIEIQEAAVGGEL